MPIEEVLLSLMGVAYLTSVLILGVPVILSLFSKKVSNFTGISSWADLVGGLVLSIFPVVNVVIVGAVLWDMLPNIPKPKHWRN